MTPVKQNGSSDENGPTARRPGRLKRKIFALNSFVDLAAPGLDHVEFRVWMILFRHAWGGIVKVSMSRLADDMGVSRKTVQRAIQRLIKKQIVTIKRKGGLSVGPTAYNLGVRELERRSTAAETPKPTPVDAQSVDTGVHP